MPRFSFSFLPLPLIRSPISLLMNNSEDKTSSLGFFYLFIFFSDNAIAWMAFGGLASYLPQQEQKNIFALSILNLSSDAQSTISRILA